MNMRVARLFLITALCREGEGGRKLLHTFFFCPQSTERKGGKGREEGEKGAFAIFKGERLFKE